MPEGEVEAGWPGGAGRGWLLRWVRKEANLDETAQPGAVSRRADIHQPAPGRAIAGLASAGEIARQIGTTSLGSGALKILR